MKSSCPSFATLLHNCYSSPTHLYIGGETILANEGVPQGDPLAMPFYAISTLPLINRLPRLHKFGMLMMPRLLVV